MLTFFFFLLMDFVKLQKAVQPNFMCKEKRKAWFGFSLSQATVREV